MTATVDAPTLSVPVPSFKVAELRVKVRSLVAEARIIRHEEARALRSFRRALARNSDEHQRWHGSRFLSLQNHRTGVVRQESRCSQLAMAFLRGRAYRVVERTTKPGNAPDAAKIARIAHAFGLRSWDKDAAAKTETAVAAWLE